MALIAFSLVVFSGLIHALWNLFAKLSINKITFFWSIHLVSFIMLMPYFIINIPKIQFDGLAVLMLLGSMFFQVFYMLCLITGYTVGELSLVYPILRGSASLLIPVTSVVLLGDRLSVWGWIGLMIILAGIILIGNGTVRSNKNVRISILIALGGGISITGYTLSDKVLLEYISPIMIFQFQNFIHVLAFLWGAFSSGKLKQEWSTNWKVILLGSLFVPGAYLLFLFALQLAKVAQLAPLREVSIVFGALLGTLFFKEQQGLRKTISSIIIVIGVIILGLQG